MALLSRLGRRLLPLAVVLTAFASVVVARPATAAPDTEEPKAYIIVDADRGQVIASKNEHEPLLTASTAKLLTAITTLERLPLDSTVPVSARAQSQPASKISMLEGQVWKLNDVLHALLMESANDAAFALAERASGSVEKFAQDANAVAKRLGAQDTVFGDPAGLDDANSFAGGTHMSAYDLAVVARNALAVPEIANTARLMTYELTDPAGVAREFSNHNKGFLSTYTGATGLKTGFTNAAGRTLVTSATRNGRTMLAVVLSTWDDTGWSSWLLDQGFTSAPDATGTGVTLPPVRVVTADQKRTAFAGLPFALGVAGLTASPATPATEAPSTTTTPPTTKPKVTAEKETTAASSAGIAAGSAPSSESDSGGGGISFGTIFNLRTVAIFLFVVLLTLFLLRRRAVRRQRARRIARQKRMAEIRRRRMIDLVDPGDAVSHVRVVPTGAQTEAM